MKYLTDKAVQLIILGIAVIVILSSLGKCARDNNPLEWYRSWKREREASQLEREAAKLPAESERLDNKYHQCKKKITTNAALKVAEKCLKYKEQIGARK